MFKKISLWGSMILLYVLVAGCTPVLRGTDALLSKAREVIPISDADTIEIQYAGLCAVEEDVLCWFISGNAYQSHYYLPMECRQVGEDAYTYTRIYRSYDRGEDIAVLQWKARYVFLVNNPACRTIRVTSGAGKVTEISIERDAYPYITSVSIPIAEYVFLDADGNEIS